MAAKITFGNSDIAGMYVGSPEVQSIWYGTTKVYEKSGGGGYEIAVQLYCPPEGDDYATPALYIGPNQPDIDPGTDISVWFEYDDTVREYHNVQAGQVDLWLHGGLTVVVQESTFNGSPLTWTDYYGNEILFHTTVNLTQNSTLYIKAYGYD